MSESIKLTHKKFNDPILLELELCLWMKTQTFPISGNQSLWKLVLYNLAVKTNCFKNKENHSQTFKEISSKLFLPRNKRQVKKPKYHLKPRAFSFALVRSFLTQIFGILWKKNTLEFLINAGGRIFSSSKPCPRKHQWENQNIRPSFYLEV